MKPKKPRKARDLNLISNNLEDTKPIAPAKPLTANILKDVARKGLNLRQMRKLPWSKTTFEEEIWK